MLISVPSKGIFFDHHKLDLGVNATMTFKGHNPLPNSFNEQGVFSLGASAFSFTGSGNFYRNAQNVIFGAGGYNVTGLSGSWQNKSGVMTALNHGAEGFFFSFSFGFVDSSFLLFQADNSFTVHLWVVFE
jgi:hypothetical protein